MSRAFLSGSTCIIHFFALPTSPMRKGQMKGHLTRFIRWHLPTLPSQRRTAPFLISKAPTDAASAKHYRPSYFSLTHLTMCVVTDFWRLATNKLDADHSLTGLVLTSLTLWSLNCWLQAEDMSLVGHWHRTYGTTTWYCLACMSLNEKKIAPNWKIGFASVKAAGNEQCYNRIHHQTPIKIQETPAS